MRAKGYLCLLSFSLLIRSLAVAQVYTVTDLGRFSPTAINTWGQIAGNYNNHAYIWSFGHMHALGVLAGGTSSSAVDINDLGMVVGTADGPATIPGDVNGPTQNCSDVTQPFVWKQHILALGVVDYATDDWSAWCNSPFYGSGINDSGQVVGYTGSLTSEFQWGILWTAANGMTLFGGSWPPTFVNGINNAGEIIGQNAVFTFSSATLGIGHATTWKNGVATDLGTLGGVVDDYGSSANGVNDLGSVVGWSTTTPVPCCGIMSPVHAILWAANGTMQDLGTLPGDTSSAASKINLLGRVVGSSGSSEYAYNLIAGNNSPFQVIGRPFIWSARHGMRDLNTLIPANSGWILNSAKDINLWGQIVGQGTFNGQKRGFLLTPLNPFQDQ